MHRTSSCNWVRGLLEMFAAAHLDPRKLAAAAGIEAPRLADPQARFSADEVSALWQIAVEQSGDPCLGLDRDTATRHINFDVVGYTMAACPDLRESLVRLSRYFAVISDAASFELLADARGAWLVLGGIGNSRPVPRQRYAFGVMAVLVLCEWLLRRPVQPLVIEFKFPQPAEASRYAQAFGCPLRFGQPENRMLFAQQILAAPIPSRNSALLEHHERVVREKMDALGATSTGWRVSEAIVRRLHRGEPRREEIAASLAMSDRTLQRRLQAERLSFQQLLDDARCELARKYLADERYTLQEVAELLGFMNAGTFFRACRRWFGEPPGRYRGRVTVQHEARVS